MIYFNLLILLIFITLFILSSGITLSKNNNETGIKLCFRRMAVYILKHLKMGNDTEVIKKQALLNPAAGGRQEARNYKQKKMAEILLILFAGNILSLLIVISSLFSGNDVENYIVGRKGYGEGDLTVDLDTTVGDRCIDEPIEITVGERQYTKEETDRIFEEIGNSLPQRILGENRSLEKVEYDLDLIDRADDYPVNIEWSVDNYDVLDSDGIIQEDVTDEKGTAVILTAALNYLGRYEDYVFPVVVYPRHMEAQGKLKNMVMRKIARYESLTVSSENLILPDKLGNMDILYKRTPGAAAPLVLGGAVLMTLVVWFGRDRDLEKQIRIREKEMLNDYPEIVSRLSLFFSAGMTIRGAFEKVAADYEKQIRKGKKKKRFAFEEILITVREMKGGVPEYQAYRNFGTRSGVRRYGKLGTLLSQNLQKGNAGITEALEAESKDAFEDRKADARRAGEEAGTKLLLPMGIMLLVVMIIVILPAFMSFSR